MAPLVIVFDMVSLFVLTRPRSMRLGSMRIYMLLLTQVELLLNIFILCYMTTDSLGNHKESLILSLYVTIVIIIINVLLPTRNWFVTMIALARCEAIVRPLESRWSNRVFTQKKLKVYAVIILLLSVMFSTLRTLLTEMRLEVCFNGTKEFVRTNKSSDQVSDEIYFSYQSAIPICLILLSTIYLVAVLCRNAINKPPTTDHKETESGSHKLTSSMTAPERAYSKRLKHHIHSEIRASRKANQLRATRMVITIAIIFMILEGAVLFRRFYSKLPPMFLKFFVVTNSLANICIYLLMSRKYRELVSQFLLPRCFLRHLSGFKNTNNSAHPSLYPIRQANIS
ncbi:hypothetical protein Ciccas_000085 [Cichlidogyrus casuarinus]|uniref:G-protein coupled receptors family 1 profile domain-containing protein n=1 Tax=Cichlidogyrus casuarinus TaxID=1844966 RepID=A0ABD2QRF6_9PLAT